MSAIVVTLLVLVAGRRAARSAGLGGLLLALDVVLTGLILGLSLLFSVYAGEYFGIEATVAMAVGTVTLLGYAWTRRDRHGPSLAGRFAKPS